METGEHNAGADFSPPQKRRSRKRSILTFTVISVVNIGLLVLLWTQLLTPAHQSSSQGAPSDPLLGQAAPNFTLPGLNSQGGQKISLADFQGKLVVINFWSSTCQPCKDEMPLLISYYGGEAA